MLVILLLLVILVAAVGVGAVLEGFLFALLLVAAFAALAVYLGLRWWRSRAR